MNTPFGEPVFSTGGGGGGDGGASAHGAGGPEAMMLARAGSDYLTKIRWGLGLILGAGVASIGATVVSDGLRVAQVGWQPMNFVEFNRESATTKLIEAVLGVASSVGYWLYSSRDKAHERFAGVSIAPALMRISAVLTGIACLLTAILAIVSATSQGATVDTGAAAPQPWDLWFMLIWVSLMVAAGVAMVMNFFATLSHTRSIAERVPDAQSVAMARWWTLLLPVLVGTGLVLAFVSTKANDSVEPWQLWMLTGASYAALIVAEVLFLALLYRVWVRVGGVRKVRAVSAGL